MISGKIDAGLNARPRIIIMEELGISLDAVMKKMGVRNLSLHSVALIGI
jgi:hypothetical protein